MIKKRVNKISWYGSDLANNRAKAPNISTPGGNGLDGLNDGEIYVCNADEDPAIFIKTNKDKVARVGGNGSDSYSRDQIDDFLRKKLDKVVWDRNLEERVDDNGEEYLFLTKPLVTAYGVTMYSGTGVQVPSIFEGLPIDGKTIQWVDGKLVATGGTGTANGIVVNGNTYTPNEDGIITLPNYPTSLEWGDITGIPTWIGNTKPSYSWGEIDGKPEWIEDTKPTYNFSEIQNKPTTLADYGITDAYTKNDISGLLADYVTKSGAQDITGVKSFINGLNIGDILVKKHSDGVVELDGDLILTGSLTMFAQGSHTASTILDALPIDETTLSKEGGVLSVIGGVGGGSVDGIILNGTTYSPDETTKLITLPNYPTTLPASDVYSWAKQPNKPSYSFSELSSHPTTLGGYGITDAYTKSDADGRYVLKAGDTMTGGLNVNSIQISSNEINNRNNGYLYLGYRDTSSGVNLCYNNSPLTYGSNRYTILHTGNYAGELDNRYVNKIGDAMTGNLVFAHTSERPSYSGSIGITFREQIANGQGVKLVYNDFDNYRAPAGLILVGEQGGEYFEAPAIYQNGYKVWDAGNKRDMFSSMNEAFTTWGNEQVISVEGDANTYYPVVITINHSKTWNSRIAIHKNLGSRTPSYPGNHGNGTSSMWAMYEGRYSGWDGNSGYIVTKYVRQPYANLISKAERAGNSVGALVVYLRGGGCEYTVCTDYRGGVNVYYERTEISGDSNYPVYVEPTTSVGNQGVLNTESYGYTVQKAVRLETPRTIFSKSFDGTGNVTGGAKFLNICIETDNNGNDSGRSSEINNYVGKLYLQHDSPNNLICCMGGGNVGIGIAPEHKLDVNGSFMARGIMKCMQIEVSNYSTQYYAAYRTFNTAISGTDPDYEWCWYHSKSGITRGFTLWSYDANGTVYNEVASFSAYGGNRFYVNGNILAAGGITMYSDLRKKNVLNSIIVPLDVMANADLFDYTFKTDEKCKVRAGTSAQYWNVFLPQVTDTDNEGFFTMSYDVLATTCVLSMAKHFQRFLIEDFGRHETEIERLKRENEELKNRVSGLERRAA